MNGHVFVITGAARGIGLELTKFALRNGAQVFAGVRTPAKATELNNLAGSNLTLLPLDVTSDKSAEAFAAAVAKKASRVDVLINNAGVFLDTGGSGHACQTQTKTYLDSIDTNTLGPIRVTTALHSLLEKSQHAVVANITSLMGSLADNSSGGSPAYRLSKTALNSFTKSLALDQPTWKVLSLHPGWVKTDMGGKGATLEPEASAAGLMKLIQDATTKQSGHFFNYNGKDLPW